MLSKDDYAKYVKDLRERTEAMMKLESGRKWVRLGLQTERRLWLDPNSTSLVRSHSDLRHDMIRAHRVVELELFGEVTEIPGEQDFLNESPANSVADASSESRAAVYANEFKTEPSMPSKPSSFRNRYLWIALVTCGIVAFALFVWPTRYRFDRLKFGTNDWPLRIDRFTGKTEALNGGGWVALGAKDKLVAASENDLPAAELTKLDATCSMNSLDLSCEIYNGSDWTLSEIRVQVKVSPLEVAKVRPVKPDSGGHIKIRPEELDISAGFVSLDRVYRLAPSPLTVAAPLASQFYSVRSGYYLKTGEKLTWTIVAARGRKP